MPTLRAAARAGMRTLVRALRARAGCAAPRAAGHRNLAVQVPRKATQSKLANAARHVRGRRSNTQPATCFNFLRLRRES